MSGSSKQITGLKCPQSSEETIDDWKLAREEAQGVKTIYRIEQLKSAHMWGLKQLPRHTFASRTKTHWDYLLDEMKWMRADFKEERKWKIATTCLVSRAVIEWYETSGKTSVIHQQRLTSLTTISSADATSDNRVGQCHAMTTTRDGINDKDIELV